MHVFFSGMVQGVSFRFTAEAIARELKILGWVKNLYDRRVEIVAEQEEEILKLFLEKIEQHFKNYIKKKQISWQDPTDQFIDFEVRF